MGENIHTVPTGDIIEHDLSESCPCKPKIDQYGMNKHIIHHSFDGREEFEDITETQ
jgi:hypothetical protein